MRVFPTGANGWVGSAVACDLLDAGHSVVGLVRSKEKGEALAAVGATSLLGSLRDLDVIRVGAGGADGIIHTAFGLDISKIVELADEDRKAIETFGEVFAGSDRPIVVTSGVGLLPRGETFREDSPRPPVMPAFPRASEQTALALAERGLRASVVRLPRSTHGVGERHGFVPMLAAMAREKGFPPTSETDKTSGRPCTGWMPRASSAWHLNGVPRTKHSMPSPRKACRSADCRGDRPAGRRAHEVPDVRRSRDAFWRPGDVGGG